MNQREAQKRLLAAKALLLEPTTTREKFTHIRNLIEGISPKVDTVLAEADQALSTVEKVLAGDVIQLSAENLPEHTEEEKKRKRALLVFIGSWNKLKSEIARVQKEFESAEHGASQTSAWGKIFGLAKGPLGIITIVAVGIVVAMQATSVKVTVQNEGCATMYLSASLPVPLPGISLPTDPIVNGQSVTATIPPLPVKVDGTNKNALTLSALTLSMNFSLPSNVREVSLNNVTLLGKKTDINLIEQKQHTLIIKCT